MIYINKFWNKKFSEWEKEFFVCTETKKIRKPNWKKIRTELLKKNFDCKLLKRSELQHPFWGCPRLEVVIPKLTESIKIFPLGKDIILVNDTLKLTYQIRNDNLDKIIFFFEQIRKEIDSLLQDAENEMIKKKERIKSNEIEWEKYNKLVEIENNKYILLCKKYQIALYEICPLYFDCKVSHELQNYYQYFDNLLYDDTYKIPEFISSEPIFDISFSFGLKLTVKIENDAAFESLKQKIIPIADFFQDLNSRKQKLNYDRNRTALFKDNPLFDKTKNIIDLFENPSTRNKNPV